jgi:hypothetical protein
VSTCEKLRGRFSSLAHNVSPASLGQTKLNCARPLSPTDEELAARRDTQGGDQKAPTEQHASFADQWEAAGLSEAMGDVEQLQPTVLEQCASPDQRPSEPVHSNVQMHCESCNYEAYRTLLSACAGSGSGGGEGGAAQGLRRESQEALRDEGGARHAPGDGGGIFLRRDVSLSRWHGKNSRMRARTSQEDEDEDAEDD